jgi:hypothetical protein
MLTESPAAVEWQLQELRFDVSIFPVARRYIRSPRITQAQTMAATAMT